jgi:hypothetical protein
MLTGTQVRGLGPHGSSLLLSLHLSRCYAAAFLILVPDGFLPISLDGAFSRGAVRAPKSLAAVSRLAKFPPVARDDVSDDRRTAKEGSVRSLERESGPPDSSADAGAAAVPRYHSVWIA